jgi:hypothetical protein
VSTPDADDDVLPSIEVPHLLLLLLLLFLQLLVHVEEPRPESAKFARHESVTKTINQSNKTIRQTNKKSV